MTEPISGARRALGEQRWSQFLNGHAQIQAELLALTMSTLAAATGGYRDEALAAIELDCRDLMIAARAHADHCRRLAREWRRQREAGA